MKARIRIMPRRGAFDPQGDAAARALRALGFSEAGCVRQGKWLEVELRGVDAEEGKRAARRMCEALLANPVMEDYEIEIAP